MAHAKGEGERCRKLIATGQDLISRRDREYLAKLPVRYSAHVKAYWDVLIAEAQAAALTK